MPSPPPEHLRRLAATASTAALRRLLRDLKTPPGAALRQLSRPPTGAIFRQTGPGR